MRYNTPGLTYGMPGVTYNNPANWPPLPPNINKPMAQDQNHRLDPKIVADDVSALEAIEGMTGYAPANTAYALTALTTKQTGMATAQATETQKQGEADAARDAANAAEWAFHNVILGAKDQVKAQFGADSDQWQSLGMTKKSERKKPARKTTTATAAK